MFMFIVCLVYWRQLGSVVLETRDTSAVVEGEQVCTKEVKWNEPSKYWFPELLLIAGLWHVLSDLVLIGSCDVGWPSYWCTWLLQSWSGCWNRAKTGLNKRKLFSRCHVYLYLIIKIALSRKFFYCIKKKRKEFLWIRLSHHSLGIESSFSCWFDKFSWKNAHRV